MTFPKMGWTGSLMLVLPLKDFLSLTRLPPKGLCQARRGEGAQLFAGNPSCSSVSDVPTSGM
jgi:hypothetical protein